MKTRAILSVMGEDRVGIVAAVSRTLAEAGANIEDIRQTLIAGTLSMTMLVMVDGGTEGFDDLRTALAADADELGVQITLQREDDFRETHRV